ncbi:uncharacterized protein LOC122080818 isoform X2 [Macadamia integrifolia]|uniref:uncharacterized protein LOC122080818 isoform X2 n=2 Tax=Macadamia integrifolia TaxID=60698 RepID=UPI001C4F92E8|nr:uncharacterized protein LOC122080818 isoform X2 [Macadamia integrifolia]
MALSFPCYASLLPQQQHHQEVKEKHRRYNNKSFEAVKNLIKTIGIPSISSSPHESLRKGNWVKLICGASFEDVVDIRNLSLVYTLAGVDCIDCAADESVVTAVNEGIDVAEEIGGLLRRPWVMISVNDDEDLHFRKAEFDPEDCPPDCSRPCEMVCPANAISLELLPREDGSTHGKAACGKFQGGVITERCYGCGRCIPVCPYDKIRAATYVRDAAETAQLLKRSDVDAVEIHTSGRQTDCFEELWNRLGDSIWHVKLVAVSLPYIGDSTAATMSRVFSIMGPRLSCYNLWQLDGRPMSGDIGKGATREAIAFAVHLAALSDRPHGFLQLAGGTNLQTVDSLKKAGLFKKTENGSQYALIGGVAYGGYARKIVGRVLSQIQSHYGLMHIEDHPDYFLDALKEALTLVGTVKCYHFPSDIF